MRSFSLIIFLLSITFLISCGNQQGSVPADVVHNPISATGDENIDELPVIEFRELLHDFGTVIEGENVSYAFKFKNTGKRDLLISNVSASCGCTATKYTKESVPPGGEGVVSVTFNTHRRRGFQHKSITVSANTQPNKTVLRIKAKVISPNDL